MSTVWSSSQGPRPRGHPILSIRARLVLLALLAVVPLMLERVRMLETGRAERLAAAVTEVVDIAKQGAEGQREAVTSVQAVLKVLARAYVTMRARGETCNFYLKDFAADMPWIKGASVAGDDGRIRCSTTPAASGIDLSDRKYFQDAVRSGDFAVSDYVIGRVQKRPSVVAAYPLQTVDPSAEGVIVTSIDLDWTDRVIASVARRHGATVLLLDGRGNVLAHHPDGPEQIGRSLADDPLVRTVLARHEGTAIMPGPDGTRRIFAFVRIPWTNAHLVVGLPESRALDRIDHEIRLAYLQLIALCLLILAAAWFGGERLIVAPIRSFARTAARYGRGELEIRLAPEGWAKEFRPLASAFNDMARRLAEREYELRASNERLAELATVDALSGLANRRGFDARLRAEWARAAGRRRPIALMMIDVDHFKLFNDCYGHVEGDACLRRVGLTLAAMADAEGDFAARYGGEEFALLLPGTDVDSALATAEWLREAIAGLAIPHAAAPDGRVTVSIGVAALVPDGEDGSEFLVEAADAGLYAAKRRGRNAVVAHGAVQLEPAD